MAEREESTSNAVKEEPSFNRHPAPEPMLITRETSSAAAQQQQQQQLGNASTASSVMMDDVQMASLEDEDDEAETCTTENDVLIKNCLSKCVLCSKNFVPEDNPKLLECLHAACTGCVNQKQSQPPCQSNTDSSEPLLVFFFFL